MPFANVERVPGGYVVSRFFAVQAAAQRGVDLLMSVNEAAFEPVRAYDAHPFDPVAAEEASLRRQTLPIRDAVVGQVYGGGCIQGKPGPGPLNLPSDADGS